MQSTHKQSHSVITIVIGILILTQIIFLIQANGFWQIPFFIVIAILASLMVFCINFYYLQSDASIFKCGFHGWQAIKSSFLRTDNLLTVKNGNIDQDYFLLKNKPHNVTVFLHPDSAAISINRNGNFRLLSPGFHELRSGETITTSFDLNMQTISCGPERGENPFSQRKTGENYASFHARQLRAQMVRSITADHQEVFPAFTIRYCLQQKNRLDEEILLNLARGLFKDNQNGPASPVLDALLTRQICAFWSTSMQKAPLAALLSGASGYSFHNILADMNTALNPILSADKTTRAVHPNEPFLAEIARLRLPFIRVYLTNVWYLDMDRPNSVDARRAV